MRKKDCEKCRKQGTLLPPKKQTKQKQKEQHSGSHTAIWGRFPRRSESPRVGGVLKCGGIVRGQEAPIRKQRRVDEPEDMVGGPEQCGVSHGGQWE